MNKSLFTTIIISIFLISACSTPPPVNKPPSSSSIKKTSIKASPSKNSASKHDQGCAEGDCINGFGTYNTRKKHSYYRYSYRPSKKSTTNALASKYVGNFQNGKKHGSGYLINYKTKIKRGNNKNRYRNKPMVTASNKYEGNWSNDKLHGAITHYSNYSTKKRKYEKSKTVIYENGIDVEKERKRKEKIKAEKAEKAEREARKAKEAAIKKRNLEIKRAAAKAKGCKGLYPGKGIKMKKQRASIMDMINIFDSDSLNDFYEVNGVDPKSKEATLRHTESGKLANISCMSIQLRME